MSTAKDPAVITTLDVKVHKVPTGLTLELFAKKGAG